MFFDDGLQAGITLALKDEKPIVCFVKDDSEKSLYWEGDLLKNDEIATILAANAITLRMQAGSQEAQYLSAYCPFSGFPTLIIIHNGQLILELKAEASQSDFNDAILAVLKSPPLLTPLHAGSLNASNSQLQGNSSSSSHQTGFSSSATNTEPDVSLQPTTTSTIQDLSRYRQQRLEVETNKRADADRAQQKATAKARHEASENVPGSSKAKQASYVQQRRKRQQEEKLEQERIRRDIECDKAARKEKEVCRSALYQTESKDVNNLEGLADQNLPSNAHRISQRSPNRCALQVRLFDGSTIRKEFQPHQKLRTDVRAWVDEQGNHRDEPYTFKQILTPMLNRSIGISEEEESLISLHLTPSATLVKVPISSFTEAYDQGIVSRGVSVSYNIASLGVNMITGALHKVLGFGQATRAAEESTLQSQSQQPAMRRTNIHIRSLQDRKEESQEHQLYNGNQLNFEPRKSEKDSQD